MSKNVDIHSGGPQLPCQDSPRVVCIQHCQSVSLAFRLSFHTFHHYNSRAGVSTKMQDIPFIVLLARFRIPTTPTPKKVFQYPCTKKFCSNSTLHHPILPFLTCKDKNFYAIRDNMKSRAFVDTSHEPGGGAGTKMRNVMPFQYGGGIRYLVAKQFSTSSILKSFFSVQVVSNFL